MRRVVRKGWIPVIEPGDAAGEGRMPATARMQGQRAVQGFQREMDSNKSLQKALRILLYMGEQLPEAGVTELASDLGLTKATVHRLLATMERFDLIERNAESERYRLGLKLHQLGSRAVESRTLRTEAHRLLLEMSRRSRETVSLATPAPGGVTCLDRLDSPHTIITVCTPVGSMFPAHCTAAGKAILAYMAEEEIDDLVRRWGLKQFTPFTITQMPALKESLQLIRRRGYAVDHQELERGLSGVAAPVLSAHERVIAAVGIAGPTLRFRGKELSEKVALVTEIGARLAMSLGRLEGSSAIEMGLRNSRQTLFPSREE
jgi:IclR family acetate operon transcriptional repressor